MAAGERIKRAAEEAAAIEKDRSFIVDYDGDATYSAKQTARFRMRTTRRRRSTRKW